MSAMPRGILFFPVVIVFYYCPAEMADCNATLCTFRSEKWLKYFTLCLGVRIKFLRFLRFLRDLNYYSA